VEQLSLSEPTLSADSAAKRAEELRRLIRYHNRCYYELDRPEITDAEYDLLFRELQKLEAEHPELFDCRFADFAGWRQAA